MTKGTRRQIKHRQLVFFRKRTRREVRQVRCYLGHLVTLGIDGDTYDAKLLTKPNYQTAFMIVIGGKRRNLIIRRTISQNAGLLKRSDRVLGYLIIKSAPDWLLPWTSETTANSNKEKSNKPNEVGSDYDFLDFIRLA